MRSACNQHAISMQLACNQHAIGGGVRSARDAQAARGRRAAHRARAARVLGHQRLPCRRNARACKVFVVDAWLERRAKLETPSNIQVVDDLM